MEQILIDGKHDYDYKLSNDTHELYCSDGDHWFSPGSLSMEVVDDGNGLTVMEQGIRLIYLDYSAAERLSILLRIINRDRTYEAVTKRERI
jgi:hypothetical protein